MNFITQRLFLFLLFMLLSVSGIQAAWFSRVPVEVEQPDGSSVNCFMSGDEYYQWIHDAEGFTLLPNPEGFYCYAIQDGGELKAGKYRFGAVNPAEVGLQPHINLPESDYQNRRSSCNLLTGLPATAPRTGLMNNLVIYIRFSDDPEFTTSRQSFDDLFNAVQGNSLKSYYSEVSYNLLNINSGHFPACSPSVNRSYQSVHPRGYYLPFHTVNNPLGYANDQERIEREHHLLKSAIEWILINSPIPSTLNIDNDNDGNVDNLTFITKGDHGSWSQVLWSHTWQLFSYDVMINGKKVWGYNLLPEYQADVKTLCHEMFHSLGAPDLYHYTNDGIQPAGSWDLMESGSGHMLSWMKYRYSGHSWINEIPEISASGTYTLNPATQATGQCFKIHSPYSESQFFVIEYRIQEGNFESLLPGSGLLIYRVDTSLNGNAAGPPDEVYIYRPNGTLTYNGFPSSANFCMETGRTAINDASNPSAFLQDGSAGGLQVFDISQAGNTISFKVQMNDVPPPSDFAAEALIEGEISLHWLRNSRGNSVLLVKNSSNTFGNPVKGVVFPVGSSIPGGGEVIASGEMDAFIHNGLGSHETCFYKIYSIGEGEDYSDGVLISATTLCGSSSIPYISGFSNGNFPDCWSFQHGGDATTDNWDLIATNNAGGTGYELRSTFQHADQGVTRAILPALNTTGIAELEIQFRHTFDDWASGATLRIQSSSDGVNWINEDWSLNSKSNQTVGPQQITALITNNLNLSHTYIAFTVEGNLFKYDYWYIDDVSVKVHGMIPVMVDAEAFPPPGGQVEGIGSYNYGDEVSLVATSSEGWGFLNWTENGVPVSTHQEFTFAATERSLLANFSTTDASLGVEIIPPLSGLVNGPGVYPIGSFVNLQATPKQGFDFDAWKLGDSIISHSSAIMIQLEKTTNLTAVFAIHPVVTYLVNLQAGPVEGGVVVGGGEVPEHDLRTVFALPYAGWIFDSWREEDAILSFQPGFTFVVERDYALKAVFRQLITIDALATPAEAGFVSGSGDFLSGDPVTLMAYSQDGWKFKGWSLNGFILSDDSSYTFPASFDCMLNAEYERNLGHEELEHQPFNLFPNPVIGNAQLELPSGSVIQSVSVYTISGQLVFQQLPGNNTSSLSLDLSSLLPGSYILRVTSVNGEVRKKLFIKAISGRASF
ncbi:MAG: M6 family metalloprotease domain-containing protein [Bacteroidales bacterium]|nr:M6 family metalloprotease domain-containing protein [Bacteroidales bacterium]